MDLSFAETDFSKLSGAKLIPAIKNKKILRITEREKYLHPAVSVGQAVTELNKLFF